MSEGAASSGTRVADGYGSSRGCWESNPGPSEEQQVLLTAKPSLQLLGNFLKVKHQGAIELKVLCLFNDLANNHVLLSRKSSIG